MKINNMDFAKDQIKVLDNSYPTQKSNHSTQIINVKGLCQVVNDNDCCYLSSENVKTLMDKIDENGLSDWDLFKNSWSNLGIDNHMADGGLYRTRRHATLSAKASTTDYALEQHQPHFQSLNYNTLNGGIQRNYEPIEPHIITSNTMSTIIKFGLNIFSDLSPYSNWHIEIHQFRIDANDNSTSSPTPEGVHRDGVSFVLMVMIDKNNIVNGETNIYDSHKSPLTSFKLTQPLDVAIVNDDRVFHGVTPIKQLNINEPASRDVLVITFRKKIFQ
jgi:hypothetical protein